MATDGGPYILLEEMCKKYGVTHYRFAKRLGIDPKNTPRMFRKSFNPRASEIPKFARAIGCSPAELLPKR